MTTNNTDGAALLPVTQADREAAADYIASFKTDPTAPSKTVQNTRDGKANSVLVQAFARHRQSHSLPGDVGMRDALSELWGIVHGCDLRLSVPMETIQKVRAALSSPLPATLADAARAMSDLQRLGQEYDGEAVREALEDAYSAGWDARHPGAEFYGPRDKYVAAAVKALPAALAHPAQATPSAVSGDAGEGE